VIPSRARFRPNRSTKHSPADSRLFAQQCRYRRLSNRTRGELACEEILRSLGVDFEPEKIMFYGTKGRFVIFDLYVPTGYNTGLAIEADGGVHKSQKGYDRQRDSYFEAVGIKTLRFTNTEIIKRPDMVKKRILEAL